MLALIFSTFSLPQIARAGSTAHAPSFSTAAELIAAVNALRATYGLAPYQTNSILMSIAQTQADYLLSAGVMSHADAAGRLPFQRALAAGYLVAGDLSLGGFFSENITGGIGQTAEEAVEAWMGDDPHKNTMLSGTLQDVGAGVGVSGNTYYYVLDCGLSTGGTPVVYTPPSAPSNRKTPTMVPNTPNADGSIVHVVQSGDTTLAIAIAYGISWTELLKLNNLTEKSIIYPGDEIIIRAAYTPTVTQPTGSPTRRFTMTPWPTSRPTKTAVPESPTPISTPSLSRAVPAAGGAVAMIVVAALVLAGLMALLGRRRKS